MSKALLEFVAKHEPRSIVFLSINTNDIIGLRQVLKQEHIIDHNIEYKCNYLVKTWELIEVINGSKSEFIYYHGFIGNEFCFENGIIHRPSEINNCVKCQEIYDITVDYQGKYKIETGDVPGYWTFELDHLEFILNIDTDNSDVHINGYESDCSSTSSQNSIEYFGICDCFVHRSHKE